MKDKTIQYFDDQNQELLESYQKIKIDSNLIIDEDNNEIVIEHGSQISLDNISKAKIILVDKNIQEEWDIHVEHYIYKENMIILYPKSIKYNSQEATL